jgi:trans-aconitate 2-methyltransferase
MSWSAEQYSKFESERNRPVLDLLEHIPTNDVKTAADIGCGPGNSTELLRDKYPLAQITGMDSSADMIDAARKRLPDIQFELADISTWKEDGPYDIILANAALQWVPDHANLFPALINKLSKGGSLAVQMPDNFEEPSHRLMREVAASDLWKDKLATASKRVARETADWYFKKLRDTVSKLDIWRTTYFHPLSGGADAIVEWFKGTGLQPYLNPLDQNERAQFIHKYKDAVGKAYTVYSDGVVLLPFPRLFIIAVR